MLNSKKNFFGKMSYLQVGCLELKIVEEILLAKNQDRN